MSVTVYIGPGPPCQVDGFSDGVERSVKGALHLRPNSLATITRDELEYVQRVHPEIVSRLRVVRVAESAPEPANEEGPPKVIALPPTEEEATEETSETENEEAASSGESEKSRGRSRSRKRRTDSD